ncbi:MAG: NADPH-dependent FMN reductase [Thermoleophilaceae bacterium]
MALKIVGLGGSLAEFSTSRSALRIALEGAAGAGASTTLLDLRQLDLPMFRPDLTEPGANVQRVIEESYEADGMLWSSPLYNGTISGSFKNALDWLHELGGRDPAYLHDEVIGLISVAGGTQGLQAINTMEYVVRSLRGWAVPYVVPIPGAGRIFNPSGAAGDALIDQQLRALGEEVVRVADRFKADQTLHRQAECEEAADRVVSAA